MTNELEKAENSPDEPSAFRRIHITPRNSEYLGEVTRDKEIVDVQIDEGSAVIHTEKSDFPVHRFRLKNQQYEPKELPESEE
jgi:hypothetical protein